MVLSGLELNDPFIGKFYKNLSSQYKNIWFSLQLNARAEILGEDRADPAMKPRFPVWYQAMWFFGVVGGSFALYFYLEDYKFGRPVTAKQYPQDGPHYQF